MLLGTKIRLIPTPEQEVQFRKSAGIARWAYNRFLGENEELYKKHKEDPVANPVKGISKWDFSKNITKLKKTEEFAWLNEVSNKVIKQAILDADLAKQRYLKGLTGKPRFKSKYHEIPRFYVIYESIKRTDIGFQGERLGNVKTAEPLPKLKPGRHYSNPRISYTGKFWVLSVGYKTEDLTRESNKIYWKRIESKKEKNTEKSLGIDVGIKDQAIVSDEKSEFTKVYPNINKTPKMRKLEKKRKREQRCLSRKMEANVKSRNKNGKPIFERKFSECKNYQKQRKKVQAVQDRLNGIRSNYIHQVTTEIVKLRPKRIVHEDLNVRGMMKNHHLARSIANQKLSEFLFMLDYKARKYGIEVVVADRWFPSSKLCSACGSKKIDLTLKDRTYICKECGFVMDRDLNASVNLANYLNKVA